MPCKIAEIMNKFLVMVVSKVKARLRGGNNPHLNLYIACIKDIPIISIMKLLSSYSSYIELIVRHTCMHTDVLLVPSLILMEQVTMNK